MAIESLQRKINKLKQDEETTKKNIQDLKQEEYNRWHIYYLETGNTIRISNILSNKRGIRG
jgi:cell division protein FtsB